MRSLVPLELGARTSPTGASFTMANPSTGTSHPVRAGAVVEVQRLRRATVAVVALSPGNVLVNKCHVLNAELAELAENAPGNPALRSLRSGDFFTGSNGGAEQRGMVG